VLLDGLVAQVQPRSDLAVGLAACHQPRHLADRQPVAHRHRAQPDERRAALLHGAAFDGDAAQRVRPVEHDDGDARARRGAERQRHRPDVRVVAAADVLEIDDEDVQAFEIGGRRRQRFERLTVQAGHRDAGARIAVIVDADHVLRLAAHAVLGSEQARGPDAGGDQPIHDVDQIAGDARRVAEHAHPAPAQQIDPIAHENVEAGGYPHTGIIRPRARARGAAN